ncbi:NACHT domain-containing protein [Hymenobacter wooponensis]|uniref:NACHT domain-containing protein n=1 Tax=Hymenobacter wooponensis TaxID=1525360 RepID=A0A4Z0MJC6_9BACT|nr:NACHT domain-containing protein [Hymenobacter wooponensis]TGD79611.1 NACHT domain-containing protein [Hymenobacter wooponensis]
MKKTSSLKAIESLPDIISNLKDWAKETFEENAKIVLDNSSGTLGLAIKLIGKPMIESYFNQLAADKLNNFGLKSYLKASYNQACLSISIIEDNITNFSSDEIKKSLLETLDYQINFTSTSQLLLIFQPKYHPAVVSTKEAFIDLLFKSGMNNESIELFKKDFNTYIEKQIADEFGEEYNTHLDNIKKHILQENEVSLLLSMVNLGRIGFSEDENLHYEKTYAEWKEVQSINDYTSTTNNESNNLSDEESKNFILHESSLKPATELIESYFKIDPTNHLDKILFIVADFGKGKSVFLRKHASDLAKKYISSGEVYIPIYFNLRNFNNYSTTSSLGVIHDFLLNDYAIDINSEYYKSKKYFFLVDSLDESGELNRTSISKVLESIKRIQNLDKTKYRTNKIIVTTRPFDAGLEEFLEHYKPYKIKTKKDKDASVYISLHGFKSDQFNNWLNHTLKQLSIKINITTPQFIKSIIHNIENNNQSNIYNELLENNTLSRSELQRPIFAYMIYQLIVNNIDFLRVGKIGVYLSFLNLLSKEAKHINDPNYTVNLKEEFEFRNILHAISSLWMFERHQGKQGALNKADICRVLDGEKSGESNEDILKRYKDQKVLEIEFLSHSYFGESSNTLHFQHQSFAEILLAEYYLKVFIKFALDEDSNTEEARAKLILGHPTDQTISFFKELLQLLKETATKEASEDIIQKRRLLFPLLASLSIRKNNLLLCNELSYNWFKKHNLDHNSSEYPEELLKDWCITENHILKICQLSRNILNSNNIYYLTESERKNSLFNKELTLIKNKNSFQIKSQIDKWLALITGNSLYTNTKDTSNLKLFNLDFNIEYINLFELIDNSYGLKNSFNSVPHWGNDLFKGIDMKGNSNTIYIHRIIGPLDFSHSYFCRIDFMGSLFVDTKFNDCTFNETSFAYSTMFRVDFNNIKFISNSYSHGHCINIHNRLIPFDIFDDNRNSPIYNSYDKIIIPHIVKYEELVHDDYTHTNQISVTFHSFLNTLRPFLKYQLKNKKITLRKLNSYLKFENKENKEAYYNSLK